MWTISTSRRASPSSSSGRVQPDDLELALDRRVVEPEVEAAALQRLGQLARVVRGEDDDRPGRASITPSSGIEIWKSESTSSSIASNSWSVLSISSISRTTGSSALIASSSGRVKQEVLAEDVAARRSHAFAASLARGLGLDPQQLLAVVPLVQRLRLVEALVALQPHQLGGRSSARAPWRARSCRPPPGPRPGPACRAAGRGRRPARRPRRPGSRPGRDRRGPRRPTGARSPASGG